MTELNVLQPEKLPTIQVNELFGSTFQGEGADIGRPCFFVRLQGCPVQCPGCDTAYTWNKTESGERKTLQAIEDYLSLNLAQNPGCGIVLSGGEPLIHYKNRQFLEMLFRVQRQATFLSIETSGFIGKQEIDPFLMHNFLGVFNTIHLSPKITPCLHGLQSDIEALGSQPHFERFSAGSTLPKLVYKFVAKDDAVVEAILKWDDCYNWRRKGYPVYLMPYGIHREEIIETSIRLLPACAKYGFILSPRLHSILWDAKRGV